MISYARLATRRLLITSLWMAALLSCGCSAEIGGGDDWGVSAGSLTQVSSGAISADLTLNHWGSGYTASVTVSNHGTTSTDAWSVGIALSGTTVAHSWNARLSGTNGDVTASNMNEDWNRVIPPGGSLSFGWNGQGSGRPELTSVSGTGSSGGASAGSGGTAGDGAGAGSGGTDDDESADGSDDGGAVVAGPAASGSGSTCDRWGQIAAGNYFAQNNVWSPQAGSQCISLNGTALGITQADHALSPNAPPYTPASYPSFVRGCHYNRCTDTFPRQVSRIARMPSTFSIGRASGTWNASYDIWFDPTQRRDGANTGLELMIWIDYSGTPQPIGSQRASVNIAGSSWEVWISNGNENGSSPTISYRRAPGNTSLTNFDAMQFVSDAERRGLVRSDWYVTSVQAGFEIWNGGAGLRVSEFSVVAE